MHYQLVLAKWNFKIVLQLDEQESASIYSWKPSLLVFSSLGPYRQTDRHTLVRTHSLFYSIQPMVILSRHQTFLNTATQAEIRKKMKPLSFSEFFCCTISDSQSVNYRRLYRTKLILTNKSTSCLNVIYSTLFISRNFLFQFTSIIFFFKFSNISVKTIAVNKQSNRLLFEDH